MCTIIDFVKAHHDRQMQRASERYRRYLALTQEETDSWLRQRVEEFWGKDIRRDNGPTPR